MCDALFLGFEMDNDPVENGPMENDPEENDTVRNNQDAELNWRSTKTVQEEQLIEEIHKRPALWNFKLPLVERSLKIKKKLWEEVSTSMNCNINNMIGILLLCY